MIGACCRGVDAAAAAGDDDDDGCGRGAADWCWTWSGGSRSEGEGDDDAPVWLAALVMHGQKRVPSVKDGAPYKCRAGSWACHAAGGVMV